MLQDLRTENGIERGVLEWQVRTVVNAIDGAVEVRRRPDVDTDVKGTTQDASVRLPTTTYVQQSSVEKRHGLPNGFEYVARMQVGHHRIGR